MANGQSPPGQERQDPENRYRALIDDDEPGQERENGQDPENRYRALVDTTWTPEPTPDEEEDPSWFERGRELVGRLTGAVGRIAEETEEIEQAGVLGTTGQQADVQEPREPIPELEEDPETRGRDLEIGPDGVTPLDEPPEADEADEAAEGPRIYEDLVADPETLGDAPRVRTPPTRQPEQEIEPTDGSGAWQRDIEARERARRRLPGAPLPDPFDIEDPMTGELTYEPPERDVPRGPDGEPLEELGPLEGAGRTWSRFVGQTIETLGNTIQMLDLQRPQRAVNEMAELPAIEEALGEPLEDRLPRIPGQQQIRQVGQFVSAGGRSVREQFPPSRSVVEDGIYQPLNPRWWWERGGEALLSLGLSFGTGGTARALGWGPVASRAAWAGPTAVLEGGGAYGETYDRMISEGASDEEAHRVASATGFMTAAGATLLEQGPASLFMFNRLPGVRGRLGRELTEKLARNPALRIGASMSTEAFQESAQEAWGAIVERTVAENPDAFEDFAARLAAAGTLGGLAGGLAGAGRVGYDAATADGDGRQRMTPELRQRFLEENQEQLDQLPTSARDAVLDALGITPAGEAAAETAPPSEEAVDEAVRAEREPGEPPRSLRRRFADFIDPSARQEREGLARELEEAYVDPKFDVANQTAWERARERIDEDPDTEVVMLDVRNLHGMNTILGSHNEADQLMKNMVGEVKRLARRAGIESRNIFRSGGDEFTVAVPRGTGQAFAEAVTEAVGEPQIGDSEFRTGFRAAVGPTSVDADTQLLAVKGEETGPRFREDTGGLSEQALAELEARGIEEAAELEAEPTGPGAAQLVADEEQLAQRIVTARIPGMGDTIDRDVIQREMERLPEEQRQRIIERSEYLRRTAYDPLAGRLELPPIPAEGEVAPPSPRDAAMRRRRIVEEVGEPTIERLEFFAERDDEIGREAQRRLRMMEAGTIEAEELVEDVASLSDALEAQRQEPVELGVLARIWEEQTGSELPPVYEQWVPRRQFIEERGVEALPEPNDLRAEIVNTAMVMQRLNEQLEAGVDPQTTEPLTDAQQTSLTAQVRRVQAQLLRRMELFRDAFGREESRALTDQFFDLETDPVTRMVDRVRIYAKPEQVRRFLSEFGGWSTEKLTERYSQYVRRWTRLAVKGQGTEARDQRATENNWGEIVTGTKPTQSGQWARGNRTQQASRIVAAASILRSRRAPVPSQREIMSEISEADLDWRNAELFRELPSMSEAEIRAELERTMSERGRPENRIAPDLDERVMLIYQELGRRGIDGIDELTTDGRTTDGPEGVRERRPAYIVREGAADMEGWWYSRLLRAIDSVPFVHPKKGEQWWARIRKSQEGVPKTELEMSGIEAWLMSDENRHRLLTRAEVERAARDMQRLRETRIPEPVPDIEPVTELEWERRPTPHNENVWMAEPPGEGTLRINQRPPMVERAGQFHAEPVSIYDAGRFFDTFEEAEAFIIDRLNDMRRDRARRMVERPRYGGWTQEEFGRSPASNYREILIQWDPSTQPVDLMLDEEKARFDELQQIERDEFSRFDEVEFDAFLATRQIAEEVKSNATLVYYSPHYDRHENILAHTRLTDRKVGDQTFTFIEENQSDLHQRGREFGYSDETNVDEAIASYRELAADLRAAGLVFNPITSAIHDIETGAHILPATITEDDTGIWLAEHIWQPVSFRARGDSAQAAWENLQEFIESVGAGSYFLPSSWADASQRRELTPGELDAVLEMQRTLNRLRFPLDAQMGRDAGPVPDAPLKETQEWFGLLVRRALQEAAVTGSDGLAMATGEQVVALYNLRHFAEVIQWDPVTGVLEAFNSDGERVTERVFTRDELPNAVGREVANELMRQRPGWEAVLRPAGGFPRPEAVARGETREEVVAKLEEEGIDFDTVEILPGRATLEGEELEIGGHGLEYLYDTIGRSVFTNEVERLGLQVEEVPVLRDQPGTSDAFQEIAVPLPDGSLAVPVVDAGEAGFIQYGYLYNDGDVDWLGADPNQAFGEDFDQDVQPVALEEAQQTLTVEPAPPNIAVRLTPEARFRILNEGLPTVREHMVRAWGSEAEQLDAFDEMRRLSLEAGDRLELVRSVGSMAYVDLRGADASTFDRAALLVRPWRSKQQKTLGYLFLDDEGTVLGQQTMTSGALDYVALSDQGKWRLVTGARRLGASRVIVWHNHPGGDPTPSPEDRQFIAFMRDFAASQGGPEVTGLIINDTEAASLDVMPGTEGIRTLDVAVRRIELTGVVPSDPAYPTVSNPTDAAELVRWGSGYEPGTVMVLYLDTRHHVVVAEPRRVEAMDRVGEWLPQQQAAFGATTAIIVTGGPGRSNFREVAERVEQAALDMTEVFDVVEDTGGVPRSAQERRTWGEGRRRRPPETVVRAREEGGPVEDAAEGAAGRGDPGRAGQPTDLFGQPVEGTADQGDLLGPAPTDTLSSARATVTRLEGRVERGDATTSELERYHQARAIVRRSEGRGLDDAEVRARRDDDEPLPDDNLDLFTTREGGADYDPFGPTRADRLRQELERLEAEIERLGDSEADIERWSAIEERMDEIRSDLRFAEAVERGDPETAAELDLGTTSDPERGLFLRRDGSFIADEDESGRPVAHQHAARWYSEALADGGSGRAFLTEFMRRGNVRWSQGHGRVVVDFIEPPTDAQRTAMREAIQAGDRVFIVRSDRAGVPFAERQLTGPEGFDMLVEQLAALETEQNQRILPDEPAEEGDIVEDTREGDAYMEVDGFDEAPVRNRVELPSDLIAFDQIIAPHLPGRLVKPEQPVPGGPVGVHHVIAAIADVTEAAGRRIPLRAGRIGSKRALGKFKVRPEVMRTLIANDIPTSVHEAAHAVEKVMWGWPKGGPWTKSITGVNRVMQEELVAMGQALYGETQPYGGYKREGWAEFFRAWMTQEEQTLALAPTFREWFEWTFLSDHPELAEAIERARWMTARYQAQGSVERARQNLEDPASPSARFRRARGNIRRAFSMEKWIEMADPLNRLSREAEERADEPLAPEEDPFFLVSALRTTHSARVKRMTENNMIDLASNPVGAPLNDVRALVKPNQYQDFAIFLWAKRAVALHTDPEGSRNPGLSMQDATQIIDELGTPAFDRAAEIVYEWNEGVLNYAAQASPIFREVVKAVRQRDPGSYVPLQRVFDQLDGDWSQTPKGAAATQRSPVKRLKGSGRRVIDPIQSMIANAESTVRAAHNRAVVDAILEISKVEGLGYLIEEVPREQVPQAQRSAMEVFNQLRRTLRSERTPLDVDLTIEGEPVDAISAAEELEDMFVTFFGPKLEPDNKDPIVPVYTEDGIKWFQVDETLFDTLSSMDVYRLPSVAGLPLLEASLGTATNVSRAGTTGLRASFGLLWNPLRDFQTLYVNTRSSASTPVLFKEWLSAMVAGAMYRTTGRETNPYLKAFLDLGGEMALPLGQDVPHTRRAAHRIVQGKLVRTLDPRNWFDWYRDFVQFPEYAPRVAELKLVAQEIGWEPGEPMSQRQALELLLAAKQVTTDFTAAGELARVINRMVPFHNASIQGPRANVRALIRGADERAEARAREMGLEEDGVWREKRKARDFATSRFMWRGMMLSVATLALWWRNKDEEWWQELDPVEKFTHWWFRVRVGDRDELVRIPRAFEVGMTFSALPEALADAWYHQNPQEVSEWMETFVKVATPPIVPQPATLVGEQLANEQFYWDRPIVPMGEERLPEAEQYNEYTSIVAREIGEMLDVSPRRVDHAISTLFGPVARDAIEAVGLGGEGVYRGGREAEPSDLVILGRAFYRGGTSGPDASVDALYDELERMQKQQASARHIESPQERTRRLMLRDASRAVTAVSIIQRAVEDSDRRRELMELRTRIARSAVEAASGQRPTFTTLRQQLEQQAEIVEQGAP